MIGNPYNKNNAPYLIAGALATLVLLASGTLAVAPYVKFLSSVAAFNVALPVALSLSILSTLILALSCKMISRNKKLAAQGAELNEKTELAAEQENTIQSLEPQIKGLNKKVSDLETKLDEISKQTNGAATKIGELKAGLNGAATKDEVEELKAKIDSAATKGEVKQLRGELGSLTEKYNQIANLGEKLDSAATKDEVEELSKKLSSFTTKLDEISKQANGATTKGEMEELSKKLSSFTTKLDEISKQANGATTKGEVEELKAKIDSAATKGAVEELKAKIDSAATKGAVEELSKKLSSFTTKLDEISKQANGATTKGEMEELSKKFSSFTTKLGEISKQANGATTKGEMEELSKKFSSFTTKLDEISKQTNGAAKKEELNKLSNEVKKLIGSAATKEELKKLNDEVVKLIDSAATKDEVEELSKKFNGQHDEIVNLRNSAATESKTQEKIFMKFCAKGEKRGKKAFEDFIFTKERKQELVNICESIKNNINIVSSAKSGDSEEEQQRGFIFHGPGGTGKSSIVEAIGDQLISLTTFIKVSGADLLEKSNINELFNKAKENAPCIVLIDEIDSIGMERTDKNRVPLNYFFTRFDEANKGVTVFATTNVSLNDLDKSLVRGDRLSTHIKIPTLDTDTRKKIINEYCQRKNLQGTSTGTILHNTDENFSPANLISLLEQIAEAHCAKTPTVTQIATICRNFKKTHGMDKVSNKQRTKGKIENSRGGSWQTSTSKGLLSSELSKVSQLEDSGYSSRCSTSTNSYCTF